MASRRSRQKAPLISDHVTGDDVIEFCEKYLFVPEGRFVGTPLKLAPFQKDIVRAIYDSPTRTAIISIPRKNAKTALCACLLLNHLVGPSARSKPNNQLFSSARSRDQAAIVFGLAAKMVRMNGDLAWLVKINQTQKMLSCPSLGTVYRALSADATRALGLSPSFIIHDELGQVVGPQDDLFDALETSVAAQENPLSVIISTQSRRDADLLSTLIDTAKLGEDERTKLILYAADPDIDPFTETAIKQANPAFDFFMNRTEVLAMMRDAQRLPAREPGYRNLILNQRVENNAPFVSTSLWEKCGDEPQRVDDGITQVYAGLDLSSVSDLTAFVMVGQKNGRWHVHPTFWLPSERVEDIARESRMPFNLWRDRGFLKTTPGASIDYDFVAEFLRREIVSRHNVQAIAFDRWNMKQFARSLLRVGVTQQQIDSKFIPFGQGWASMSPSLRALEQAILDKKIAHGGHPVLASCMMNACIITDDAGNRKFSKRKSSGKIDGAVALVMAMGVTPEKPGGGVDIDTLIA